MHWTIFCLSILCNSYILGHSSMIGLNTQKVVDFDLRTRSCSVCQFHKGRNETVPTHDCNVNWSGK